MGADLGERRRQANVDHDWMDTNVWIQVGILVREGDWESSRDWGGDPVEVMFHRSER